MPARKAPESAEDIAIRQIEEEDAAALERIAREMGPPPDADKVSEREEVELWGQRDPAVDYLSLAKQLLTAGLPEEALQGFALLKEYPDLAPLFMQPTQDFEMANTLARLAEHPYRLAVLDGIHDPDELTTKAESLDRAWQKQQAAADAALMMPPTPEEGAA